MTTAMAALNSNMDIMLESEGRVVSAEREILMEEFDVHVWGIQVDDIWYEQEDSHHFNHLLKNNKHTWGINADSVWHKVFTDGYWDNMKNGHINPYINPLNEDNRLTGGKNDE